MGESQHHSTFLILRVVLNNLIANKQITLRKLLHAKLKVVPIKTFSFTSSDRFVLTDFPIILLFQVLEMLFDSTFIVEKVLTEMSETYYKNTFGRFSKAAPINIKMTNMIYELAIPFLIDHDQLNSKIEQLQHERKVAVSLPAVNLGLLEFEVSERFGSTSREKDFRFIKFTSDNGEQVDPYKVLLAAYRNSKRIITNSY